MFPFFLFSPLFKLLKGDNLQIFSNFIYLLD